MKGILIICLALALIPRLMEARTITCYPDIWPNIPQAFALADSGDTILATPGVYLANHDSLRVNCLVPDIFLMSEAGPESTVVDGQDVETDWPFLRGLRTTVEGFTIRNVRANYIGGGAISGGTTVRGSVITRNYAVTGGGIQGCTVEWCVITYNSAQSQGGGAYSSNIYNSIIAYNTAPDGGGVFYHRGLMELHYNNIYGNSYFGVKNLVAGEWIHAENNWWGDASGPYNPWRNPDGKGDLVSEYVYFDPWLTEPGVMETNIEHGAEYGTISHLYIYPNPCRGTAKIHYSVPTPGHVNVSIFDVTGRLVETLVDEWREAGIYSVSWGGKNLSCGTHLCELRGEELYEVKKIVVLDAR